MLSNRSATPTASGIAPPTVPPSGRQWPATLRSPRQYGIGLVVHESGGESGGVGGGASAVERYGGGAGGGGDVHVPA